VSLLTSPPSAAQQSSAQLDVIETGAITVPVGVPVSAAEACQSVSVGGIAGRPIMCFP
jgi:hypothetical protein